MLIRHSIPKPDNFIYFIDTAFLFSFIIIVTVSKKLTLTAFSSLQNKITFTFQTFHRTNSVYFNQKSWQNEKNSNKMDDNLFPHSLLSKRLINIPDYPFFLPSKMQLKIAISNENENENKLSLKTWPQCTNICKTTVIRGNNVKIFEDSNSKTIKHFNKSTETQTKMNNLSMDFIHHISFQIALSIIISSSHPTPQFSFTTWKFDQIKETSVIDWQISKLEFIWFVIQNRNHGSFPTWIKHDIENLWCISIGSSFLGFQLQCEELTLGHEMNQPWAVGKDYAIWSNWLNNSHISKGDCSAEWTQSEWNLQ
jgi:hypothetical protein